MASFHSKLNNAMHAYKKRTKKDILLDPLVVVFQTCNDSDSAFSVLREQPQLESWNGNDELMTALRLTIQTLYAISLGIGPGVLSPEKVIMVAIGIFFSVRIFRNSLSPAFITLFFRRLRRVAPVKMRSTFSQTWKNPSNNFRLTLRSIQAKRLCWKSSLF